MKNKKYILGTVFCFFSLMVYAESLPDWFLPLREAIYEQNLKADAVAPLYREVKRRAEESLSGQQLYLMLSRCEYMMGRVYLYDTRKDEALARFEEGIALAQRSLDMAASPEGWVMLAENLSQSCTIKSVGYVMQNGPNVERYAKEALALDPGNTAAQFLIASRWVYAPSPFNNLKRGIQMMEDILNNFETRLQKDDRFNVYSAIGYAYLKQKKNQEAKTWFQRSLAVYPTNQYVQELLSKT
ncbi:tetratricopeptide repeat protein [Treponema sp. TIM-1]|uniref:tetratricopeptide repeat protein n=1 Tax=Treponema sp. TIM-1 TaxID=2898417 RepID=UPI00398183BE